MSEPGATEVGPAEYPSVPGLRVEQARSVLSLTLDRPDRRNAIDDSMMRGLVASLEMAGRDESVRAIVLRGAGDHFCGGADIVARNAPGDSRPRPGSIQRRLPTQAHRLIPLLLTVQLPVVCEVRGWAAGIGLQLALASDFSIVAEDARLWEPFTARGFTPDSGATWLLPRLVGMVRARQLLLLGRELSGREAQDWGLVHRAVPQAELGVAVDELVNRLAAGPTVALGLTKWLLGSGAELGLDPQLRNEAFALELSSRTADFREGLQAFVERRSPEFGGR
jgi:2-(1,2-epoxy-1,2-dihydrophenyl)acetyl-CoA isomerase